MFGMSSELSVAQLERLLEGKRSQLDSLYRRREKLQKELSEIDQQIVAVGGGEGIRRGNKGRKRPKNEKTLLQVVLEVLGTSTSKKGMGLGEISAKVLESGYKTGAYKFENTVYQCLYNNTDKIHHDLPSRTYKLK
jgi:hypothetical protein